MMGGQNVCDLKAHSTKPTIYEHVNFLPTWKWVMILLTRKVVATKKGRNATVYNILKGHLHVATTYKANYQNV